MGALFAGAVILITTFSQHGWTCAHPTDVSYPVEFNLLNPLFMAVVIRIVLEGRVSLLHLDPPRCTDALLDGAIMDVSMAISKAAVRTGSHVQWSPCASARFVDGVVYFFESSLSFTALVDCCCGSPWLQSLELRSTFAGISAISLRCPGDHRHCRPPSTVSTGRF